MDGHERRDDRFTALEERYAGYEVYDVDNERLGKVDDLWLDEDDRPEYIGVKVDGVRSTLIPMEVVTVNAERKRISVPVEKARVRRDPAFSDEQEITPEDEAEVRSRYGLESTGLPGDRGGYGDYYPGDHTTGHHTDTEVRGDRERGNSERGHSDRRRSGEVGPGMRMGDTESGEFRGHSAEMEGVRQPGSDLEDEDELRVQRSEEELRARTRERDAGSMRVRKRIRTERERLQVPTRREQVSVERIPLSGEATEAEIGEDEVSMPVTEEEVVVEKRVVAKEEIRVRKDVVHDEEIIEEDVRKEEVEVEDATERGQGLGR